MTTQNGLFSMGILILCGLNHWTQSWMTTRYCHNFLYHFAFDNMALWTYNKSTCDDPYLPCSDWPFLGKMVTKLAANLLVSTGTTFSSNGSYENTVYRFRKYCSLDRRWSVLIGTKEPLFKGTESIWIHERLRYLEFLLTNRWRLCYRTIVLKSVTMETEDFLILALF